MICIQTDVFKLLMCTFFFSDDNAIAAIKILVHMLPAGGRKRAAGVEAFGTVFVVISVGFQFFRLYSIPTNHSGLNYVTVV
jgi:hypothetical protein